VPNGQHEIKAGQNQADGQTARPMTPQLQVLDRIRMIYPEQIQEHRQNPDCQAEGETDEGIS
jgi:hypothetical protein